MTAPNVLELTVMDLIKPLLMAGASFGRFTVEGDEPGQALTIAIALDDAVPILLEATDGLASTEPLLSGALNADGSVEVTP